MAPVLQILADGDARPMRELVDLVAARIGLTAEDRQETISSGIPVIDNRVHWAVTYLFQAGLVRRPRRAVVEITDRGRVVLKDHPNWVDNSVLYQFEEFRDFKSRTRSTKSTYTPSTDEPAEVPPLEKMEVPPLEKIYDAAKEADAALAAEVLERVLQKDPVFLERLLPKLLGALGYGGPTGSAEHVGGPGDGGIDGVIRQDALGLDQIYVQAKRYAPDRAIGRPDIQAFVGALHGGQADRGIFVTTSRFSAEAKDYAERVNARLVLIDGLKLAQLMVDHNIGVQAQRTFVFKRVDEDFFDET